MYKVFLTGGDSLKWATDDDLNLLRECLSSFCEITSLDSCEVIHSVNWHALLNIDPEYLANKYVIPHIPHDVKNMLTQPDYLKISPYVDKWIVMSKRAKKMLDGAGLDGYFVPYPVDLEKFHKIERNSLELNEIRRKYNIPSGKYLIGNFQRDTEGADLKTPKYMKGPDIFLEIIKSVCQRKKDVCVVLAGPRRFWLIKQLSTNSIPFIYIGERIEEREKDDIHINTLSQETINCLYNIIDLYVASGRLEGGPKSIIECATAKCKIISTNVGQASQILTPTNIYSDAPEGINLILKDIETDALSKTVDTNFARVLTEHTIEAVSKCWGKLYQDLADMESRQKEVSAPKSNGQFKKTLFHRLRARLGKRDVVTILHTFHKPPWGGGNQFLLALKAAIARKGYTVINKPSRLSRICLFNSFTFDMKLMEKAKKFRNSIFIHRVDGPTLLVRGKDKELDDKVFQINNEVADITIFQSLWSLNKTIELGYKPVNPIIIPNAVDSSIFNSNGRVHFSKNKKLRVISTSWSNNPRKGFNTYKWLDTNLNWDRFEYIFVGNMPTDLKFENIKHVLPVTSEELATILKSSHIYIIASENDPCSNALIEALACGLPTIYLNDGGHPELVQYGGLPFNTKEEIPKQLECLVDNYEMFQNLIVISSIDQIAERYLALLNLHNLHKSRAHMFSRK